MGEILVRHGTPPDAVARALAVQLHRDYVEPPLRPAADATPRLAPLDTPSPVVFTAFRQLPCRVVPLAAAGIVSGVLLAGVATRMLRTHLLGVEPGDPVSYLAAIAAVTLSLLLAAVRPLVRAARVDPIATLRE